MAVSPQFASIAKTALGSAGGAATGIYWIWRILKNRTITAIRKKLHHLGIMDETAVRAWMNEWTDDSDHQRGKNAKKLLADEKTREALVKALTDLVRNREFQQLDGLMSRVTTFFSAISHLLFPPSVGTNERETLDFHGQFVLEELRRFKTSHRAGRPLHTGKEPLTLKRLLRYPAYGEVWLAIAGEPDRQESEVAPRDRRIIHFLTKVDPDKRVGDLDEIRAELKSLAHLEGIVDTYLAMDGQTPYLVTEYIRGVSLKQWLVSDEDQRVKLNKEEIMAGLIHALAEAHEKRIFHRRLCPSCILLTVPFEPGRTAVDVQAKIADFWVSRLTHQPPDPTYATSEGRRAELMKPDEREAKADIFALGVLWYQFMMGDSELERPPYDFFDQLNDSGQSVREWIKGCLANSESQFDDAVALRDKLHGVVKELDAEAVDRPVMPTLEGFFDVSDLLQDFLAAHA